METLCSVISADCRENSRFRLDDNLPRFLFLLSSTVFLLSWNTCLSKSARPRLRPEPRTLIPGIKSAILAIDHGFSHSSFRNPQNLRLYGGGRRYIIRGQRW